MPRRACKYATGYTTTGCDCILSKISQSRSAQELAFRYSTLKPEAKKSTRKTTSRAKSAKSIADLERARTAEKKGGAEATKKQTRPRTVDDLLEEIDSKIDMIKGTARAETCRQMIETISKDSSLTESDKQLLMEKLRDLAGAS